MALYYKISTPPPSPPQLAPILQKGLNFDPDWWTQDPWKTLFVLLFSDNSM